MTVLEFKPTGSFGPKKGRKSSKEMVDEVLSNSTLRLIPANIGDALGVVGIELHGNLSQIPSLKNSKIPKTNYPNPEFMGRVKAMDQAYERAAQSFSSFAFRREEVFILLLLPEREGGRGKNFDVDNVLSTVKDWLEPKTKIKGGKEYERGWGVGLYEDDNQARGLALKWSDIGFDFKHAYIEVLLRKDVRPHMLNFANFISQRKFLVGGEP